MSGGNPDTAFLADKLLQRASSGPTAGSQFLYRSLRSWIAHWKLELEIFECTHDVIILLATACRRNFTQVSA